MVVVEKLRKSSHFIPVQSTYRVVKIANIFMQNIFRLHGVPKNIISHHDVKFTSAFWKALFKRLAHSFTSTLLITLRRMDKLSE